MRRLIDNIPHKVTSGLSFAACVCSDRYRGTIEGVLILRNTSHGQALDSLQE